MPYTVVAVPDSFAQLDTEMTTLAGDVPAWQNDGIAVSQTDPDPVTGTISLSLATPSAAQLSALGRLGWLGRHLAATPGRVHAAHRRLRPARHGRGAP